ncbi:gamma-glutamylcyclotransferase [Polaromonas sp.]|uniref:gamma-glutamylcyclotransferase n=1 Tax=Polaromonas sp. TaxID=1869339 RepID=UPI00248A47E4|nr:gamma-glutamylcyclotransferase [Polaromonas sp.]MDI1340137.1 gamma-glutamylcyclotransferase [Polaromonas sp.]
MLDRFLHQWGGREDLWIFGYASLIWRPDFDFAELRRARVHGWHRALKMWSRINRGTPECPGLVFALLSGGSCHGVVYRVPKHDVPEVVARLWLREMATAVYDPRLLRCNTDKGLVQALAFTLSRRSPSFTGDLSETHYRQIFSSACGRYGTTHDYARKTLESLHNHGISDARLARLLKLSQAGIASDGPQA